MLIGMTLEHARQRRLGRDTSERLRVAIRYLLERGQLLPGSQARLASYYGITRQRVHQIVVEERQALAEAS
jgi:hypothetical protein